MARTADPQRIPPLAPDTPAAMAVTLDDELPGSEGQDPSHILRLVARQLPKPSDLPPGTWCAVDRKASKRRGFFRRKHTANTSERIRLAVCCTALAAVGYEMVCADSNGTAYGRSPRD